LRSEVENPAVKYDVIPIRNFLEYIKLEKIARGYMYVLFSFNRGEGSCLGKITHQ